jgi:hypothetical protein
MAYKFRFRKSFTILPGFRLNFGKTGFTSLSVGGRGMTANFGRKGTRMTFGIPGTGCSWSEFTPKNKSNIPNSDWEWPKSTLSAKAKAAYGWFYGGAFAIFGIIIIYCMTHGKAL